MIFENIHHQDNHLLHHHQEFHIDFLHHIQEKNFSL
jgi:hypothetical protein